MRILIIFPQGIHNWKRFCHITVETGTAVAILDFYKSFINFTVSFITFFGMKCAHYYTYALKVVKANLFWHLWIRRYFNYSLEALAIEIPKSTENE
jgi:hypothetical protein